MTCKEKLKMEHPDKLANDSRGGCKGCPHMVGYMPRPGYCPYGGNDFDMLRTEAQKILCTECWNREIPETKEEPETNPTEPEQEPTTEPTEQKSSIPSMTDLQWLLRKALGYPGIAVSITFMEDAITFNAYPYPTQEEETNESR